MVSFGALLPRIIKMKRRASKSGWLAKKTDEARGKIQQTKKHSNTALHARYMNSILGESPSGWQQLQGERQEQADQPEK
jgi:hypothetical protein